MFFTVLWRLISFKQGGQNDPVYALLEANILCFICRNSCKASHGQMKMVSETSSVSRLSQASRQCILMKSWSWCVLRLSCSVLSIIDWFLGISKLIQFSGKKSVRSTYSFVYASDEKEIKLPYKMTLHIPSCQSVLQTFSFHFWNSH